MPHLFAKDTKYRCINIEISCISHTKQFGRSLYNFTVRDLSYHVAHQIKILLNVIMMEVNCLHRREPYIV